MSAASLVLAGVLALPAAGALDTPAPSLELGAPAALRAVDVVEHLGERVPLDLELVDSTSRKVTLKELFAPDRPLVLVLAYYRCPTLCGLVLGGVAKAVKQGGIQLGEDYRIATVSIDPQETTRLALERKRTSLLPLGRDESDPAWSFLIGSEQNVRTLAERVGFGYAYDEQTKQYAHAAVVLVLTPDGRISRYLYGVEFPQRDFRLALVEASGGRVGTSFDRVILKCFRYDPVTRRYGFYLSSFLKGGALLVFGCLATLLGVLWRREVKRGTVS